MDKKALRKQFLQLRLAKQWDEEQLRIIEHLKAYFSSRTFRCVGLYWPIKNEIDVRSIRELCSQGFIERLALPRLEGQRMRFFYWDSETLFSQSAIGLIEPRGGEEVVPEMLLVPCVALDRAGYRLGYGGGYFDRYLMQYPQVKSMGVLAQAFWVDSLPQESFDCPLDAWVTEEGIFDR